jgi:sulfur carrier protein
MPAKGKVANWSYPCSPRGFILKLSHTDDHSLTDKYFMELFVNNKTEKLQSGNTLSGLLSQLGLHDKRGIAVAVNNAVISKPDWTTTALKESDKITIIRPTQGG